MKTNKALFLVRTSIALIAMVSCNSNEKADGYGNFEATEITVSAENNGKLNRFELNEGDVLQKGAPIGYIDTIPLSLKRKQLLVSKEIISSKSKGVLSQIAVLNAQLKTANTNKSRTENLIKDNAGTQKQLDDVTGEINVIKQQINSIEIQNAPVVNELKNIDLQIKEIEDLLQKSILINPVSGTVLAKYTEPDELVSFGKPLYKIADLTRMQLRVYVSETQLSEIKIGQEVIVKVDDKKEMKSYKGTIYWVASEAEFTPKIIQTKEERVALVYAVKVDVENDGSLKIGMPAEMWIKNE
ncbi:MAG: HlyD family secretion protein [Flavobacteriaceae bacterium CG_4_8_14_3_um_filter_34_10]|nr:HlyD family efflux transporter periplasmic adaptor subunit [Flavobacteriia bacterium]PIV51705.1 MAG: HlyD family secretion protein [Flavobacteriaceae bacterium CG02_land_8_20_14_3_00_34_13]PIX09330.1 MAG: HlyD family secretion protein [Flavobacteriaceae bacterium CG_4_8_14_3_um_filter_34_10]